MHTPKVLVVDDEESYCSIYCRFLSTYGYQMASATSARDALTLIGNNMPHLALVDIAMPRIDGIMFLKLLRSHISTANLPVVLMTALLMPDSVLSLVTENLNTGPIFIKGHNLQNLQLRIESELHKSPDAAGATRLPRSSSGIIAVDRIKRKLCINDREVKIPMRRFDLFCALFGSDAPISRQTLHREIWPDNENPNVVAVNIHRLRRDLSSCPNIRIKATAFGYRLVMVGPRMPSHRSYNL